MTVVTQGFRQLHKEGNVTVLQDADGHLHFYYNGVYRMAIAIGFWNDGQLSFREEDDYLAIVMAGNPDIIRIPLKHAVMLPVEEDEFPEFIDDSGMAIARE